MYKYLALITAEIYYDIGEYEGETRTIRTIAYASTYGEAADYAEEIFGNDLQGPLTIELLDIIPHFTEEDFRKLRNQE